VETRGWLEARKGSGVYVRDQHQVSESSSLYQLIENFLAETRARGFSAAEVRESLARVLGTTPVRSIVVIEPEPELCEILTAELRQHIALPVTAGALDGAAAVALGSRVHALPPGVPHHLLRMRSVPEYLQGQFQTCTRCADRRGVFFARDFAESPHDPGSGRSGSGSVGLSRRARDGLASRPERLPVRHHRRCDRASPTGQVYCTGIPGDFGRLYSGVAAVPDACDRSESVLSRPSGGLQPPYSEPMKFLLPLTLMAVASVGFAADIPAGTHLLLRMEHSVSSGTAKVGDGVHLRTTIPLSAAGKIVIPIGSYAQGEITDIKHGRRGRAELQIQLMTLMLPNGEIFKVSPKTSSVELESRPARPEFGRHSGVAPLALTVAGAIAGGQTGARVGLAVGAAAVVISAIAGHRQDVDLRQGAAVDVVFDRPAVLE
jgi:hypothetical protein